ncbi:MAG: methyltransferase domain-containing protein [Pseudomonadales bacterium]|nr:methyltransferase domain-containing protein [Pseudomonadales bacterium]
MVLLDWWAARRNALLGSRRFQLWAGRFPLTRPIARRQAGDLFDLCAGFVYSQVLFAVVQLRLCELVSDGPQQLSSLARHAALPEDRMARLLDAAVSLRLLERRGEARYGLGPLGAVLVQNQGIKAMVRHHALFYRDLNDPLSLLRGDVRQTGLTRYWPYADSMAAHDLDSAQVGAYSELMAVSQNLIAAEVLNAYSLARHRCLLDVGGGTGAFLSAVAGRWPHLRLMLFDLPAVIGQAGPHLPSGEPGQRLQVFGGDFFVDPLPPGADIVSLIRVLHDHNDDDALRLLRAICSSLPDGGTLLLAEPMAGHRESDRVANAYFGFYLMAMGKGRARSPVQIGSLLRRAGFSGHRLLANPMPLQTRIIVASK